MRDGHDKSLIPKYLDGAPGGVTGNTEQVHKILFRGQRVLAWPELARFDPGTQPCRELPVGRYRTTPVDLGHIHDHKLADQQRQPILAYVGRRRPTLGASVTGGYTKACGAWPGSG